MKTKNTKTLMLKYLFSLSFILLLQSGFAQQDSVLNDNLFDMSLEDLMNLEVTVASKTAMTQRESPAIVSVVTQTEIENSGARDLVDVLRLIPGIEFGVDVQGQVGLTMRGNWGHEGKVLLMIDGQEINELAYSTVVYGNHYPVDNIKRIEIIRGPGSSIYGGFAELGVINIITESGKDLNGIKAVANYAHTGDSGSPNIGLSIGKKTDDLEFSLSGFYRDGNRSDRDYTDMYGDTYSMTDNSNISALNINTGIKYKNLSVRFIYDDYKTDSRDLYDENLDHPYNVDFASMLGEIKYDWKINNKLTLTPKFNYIQSNPWLSSDDAIGEHDDDLYSKYDRTVTRLRPNLTASYDLNEKTNILAGVEYTQESGVINPNDGNTYYDGSTKLSFGNLAAFGQGIIKSNIANIVLGLRYENHSEFGSAVAPRIGLTKAFDKFHTKLLYSMAFRSPGIENINNNAFLNPDLKPNIKPEVTQVIELEVGYNLTENMLISANIYHIKLDKTIVYFIDENTGDEGYANVDVSGTKGLDLEYKIKQQWGYANLTYSYYSAKGINKVPDYSVPTNEKALLGTPQHKITLNSSFNVYKGLSINPSLAHLGKRYAYTTYDDVEDDVVLNEMNPLTMLNIFINYRNILVDGLNIGVGAYNILNADYDFIQPYNGWHAPYPGKGTEFIFKLSYNLNFK